MAQEFTVGDPVQTPLGKGVVREVRNNGRVLVEVHGRSVVMDGTSLGPLQAVRRTRTQRAAPSAGGLSGPEANLPGVRSHAAAADVDLHGLTVPDAMARVEQALNDAMLTDRLEVRLIHGRSGGRIRAALHRRLAEIPSVRGFRVDPHNPGVTIVVL